MNRRQTVLLVEKKMKLEKELGYRRQENYIGRAIVGMAGLGLIFLNNFLLPAGLAALLGIALSTWASREKRAIEDKLEEIEFRLAGK